MRRKRNIDILLLIYFHHIHFLPYEKQTGVLAFTAYA